MRKEWGMTQKQLCDKTGIPLRTWQGWERGLNKPPEYVLKLLIYYLERNGDNDSTKVDFYDQKTIRVKYNMTQKEFFEKTGIPVRTMQDWEGGISRPSKYVVKLLVYFLENEKAE